MHAEIVQPICATGLAAPVRSAGPLCSRALLIQIAFVGLYIGVLAWFGVVDVYGQHFFAAGPVYLGYALARVLFIAYLGWIQFFLGRRLLQIWQRRGAVLKLNLLDEFILCFYAGGALIAGFTFVLGFLNLFYYWLFAVGSVGLIAWSSAEALPTIGAWGAELTGVYWRDRRRVRQLSKGLALLCVLALAFILLAVKGLHPGGGKDYFTHYFPYFSHVLSSHGLWPNDVWYHFYFSKGSTVTMSSILLTDLEAPAIVTYLYFMVATLCVYSLIRRWVNNHVVPLLGMAACIGAFFWTVHPIYGQWGHFQKHHEFTCSLVMSIVWLLAIMRDGEGPSLKAWMTFLAIFVGHCVLFTPTIYPLLFALLVGMSAVSLVRRAWSTLRCTLTGLGGATFVLAATMTINFLCTGMAGITPMRFFWKYADQERFSHWVSPYMMTLLLEGSSPKMGSLQFADEQQLCVTRMQYLQMLVHADAVRYFFPDIRVARDRTAFESEAGKPQMPLTLGLVVLVIGAGLFLGKRLPFQTWRLALPVFAAFAAAIVLSTLAGHSGSAFRCYSFFVFLSVLIAIGLWATLFRLHSWRKLVLYTSYVLPAVLICVVSYKSLRYTPKKELTESLYFTCGQCSLAEGYRKHGMTSDVPVAIRQVIGCEPRVYTLDLLSYTTAPGCELESFVSFSFRDDYHEILFESPERARAALQKQGLNYFLIDLTNGDLSRVEILQHAPLFRPENLEKYFQVRWRRDNTVLLTWPGPDTAPLPEEFLHAYAAACENDANKTLWRPLYQQLETIYEMNHRKAFPVYRDPSLPLVKGWQ